MKLSSLKPGDQLVADSGFTCLADQELCQVFADVDGHLYVPCDEGRHYLGMQGTHHDPDEIVGFEVAAPEEHSSGN